MLQYESHRLGREFFADFYASDAPIALFCGPPLSGKTTIIKESLAARPPGLAVALVDGAGCRGQSLLEMALAAYGYREKLETQGELIAMLRVFSRQQTAAGLVPLLVIDNAHELERDSLEVLVRLEDFRLKKSTALQIILVSSTGCSELLKKPAFSALGKSSVQRFELEPMSPSETGEYLQKKLEAAGISNPERFFPTETCERLYAASGGWPGIVERLAIMSLQESISPPQERDSVEIAAQTTSIEQQGISATPPRLMLTLNGEDVECVDFHRSRFMIGRSLHNDLVIDSRFISRYHILLTRNDSSVLLMDLNSRNGTYVNSRQVMQSAIRPNDIISIGNYRLKYLADGDAAIGERQSDQKLDETAVMRTLGDSREAADAEKTGILSILKK